MEEVLNQITTYELDSYINIRYVGHLQRESLTLFLPKSSRHICETYFLGISLGWIGIIQSSLLVILANSVQNYHQKSSDLGSWTINSRHLNPDSSQKWGVFFAISATTSEKCCTQFLSHHVIYSRWMSLVKVDGSMRN